MRNKKLFGTLLLCGSLLTALPSCDKDTIIETPPNQAELNIQMIESFEVKGYTFVSPTLDLEGDNSADKYVFEDPFLIVNLFGDQYRFDLNKLIAVRTSISGNLILYFP